MSTIEELYDGCLARMKEISTLASITGLLAWDQETMMPPAGAAARAEQSSVLSGILHEKFVDSAMGDMLRELNDRPEELDARQRAVIRERLHDYEKSVKLPSSLVRELSLVASQAQTEWIAARKASDFARFAPWIEKTVALKREQAAAYGYENHPYDALLDDYEPHMTVEQLDPVMDAIRRGLVPIVAAIRASSVELDDEILKRHYPAPAQESLFREIMKRIGINDEACRLDRSAHPFCAGISSPSDVRVTTRIDEGNLHALYSVLHESGHALYEQGMDEGYVGTPLAESVSLGIHESQSRLWENTIGRSRSFITFLMPLLKKRFPEELGNVDEDAFHHALNSVRPTAIRIESDEVTYNLHILLRYEIEKALLTGETTVNDLPAVWNERMNAYLGVTPENDARGVLQDTHWASGLFGYFPTYLLGNLYAAQLWRTIQDSIDDIDEMIAQGSFGTLRSWLHDHIHRHGRRYTAAQLVEQATGSPLDAEHFLSYLKRKFGALYSITSW